jgi:hypothetical protein
MDKQTEYHFSILNLKKAIIFFVLFLLLFFATVILKLLFFKDDDFASIVYICIFFTLFLFVFSKWINVDEKIIFNRESFDSLNFGKINFNEIADLKIEKLSTYPVIKICLINDKKIVFNHGNFGKNSTEFLAFVKQVEQIQFEKKIPQKINNFFMIILIIATFLGLFVLAINPARGMVFISTILTFWVYYFFKKK